MIPRLVTEGQFDLSEFEVSPVPYLHGLDHAKEILREGLSRGLPVVLKGDPDVDGLLAYNIASEMLTEAKIPFHACVNTDRRHGIVEEEFVECSRTWKPTDKYIPVEWHKDEVIINVDSSFSADEMQMLVNNGCFVISLDHHELEMNGYPKDQQVFMARHDFDTIGEGIIINNQYSFEPEENRFWSGAGVVLHALSYILGIKVKREWVAMHGVTLLSDVRDIENDLAREILKVTYSTPLSMMPKLRKLARASQVEVPDIFARNPDFLDRTFIDFSFSPYINASYQLNLGEVLFRMVDDLKFLYAPPSKTVRKGIVSSLETIVKVRELEHLTVLMLDVNDFVTPSDAKLYNFTPTSFLGLLANKYLSLGKTVFIACKDGNVWKRGSVRGRLQTVDYRELFGNVGFVVKGHKGAFGITEVITPPNLQKLSDAIGVLESQADETKGITVFRSKDLLEDLDKLKELAYDNEFRLSQNFNQVVYAGFSFTVLSESKAKIAYNVSGMFVDSFDKELDPKNAIIIPTIVDCVLALTLRKPLNKN